MSYDTTKNYAKPMKRKHSSCSNKISFLLEVGFIKKKHSDYVYGKLYFFKLFLKSLLNALYFFFIVYEGRREFLFLPYYHPKIFKKKI